MGKKIIQFGEGVFLRAFFERFAQGLNDRLGLGCSVTIVQPRPGGSTGALRRRDCRYDILLRGVRGAKTVTELIPVDCVTAAIDPYETPDEFFALALDPDAAFVVSNTTEAGIYCDPSEDLSGAPVLSFAGKLTQLLYLRYGAGLPGLTILPCELIPRNGAALRDAVLGYAAKYRDPSFAGWIERENRFIDTLVDCIVSGFRPDAAALAPGDELLDVAEPYHLWVVGADIEDELPLRRAGFNVVYTDDVERYRRRKVAILNGAHTAMTMRGILLGMATVSDCMDDPELYGMIRSMIYDEVLPVLGDNEENASFAADVLERFKNPFLGHRLSAIAMNSVSKYRERILPTLTEYNNRFGSLPPVSSGVIFDLIRLYKSDPPPDDPAAVAFIRDSDIGDILANEKLWGASLSFLKGICNND